MDLDEEDENPLLTFVPLAQKDAGAGIQDVRMIRGQVDHSVRLPYAANYIFAKDDALYAFNNRYVMTCRMDEAKARTYALPEGIYVDSVLGLTENHSAIVSSGGTIYMVPLP